MNRELAKVDVSGDVLYIRADDDSATTTDVDLAKRDESGRLVYVADRTTDVGRANALYFVEGFGERTTDAYFALRTLDEEGRESRVFVLRESLRDGATTLNPVLAARDGGGSPLYVMASDETLTTTDVALAKRDADGRLIYTAAFTLDSELAELVYAPGDDEETTEESDALRERDSLGVLRFVYVNKDGSGATTFEREEAKLDNGKPVYVSRGRPNYVAGYTFESDEGSFCVSCSGRVVCRDSES